jgi:hypothetical protein
MFYITFTDNILEYLIHLLNFLKIFFNHVKIDI